MQTFLPYADFAESMAVLDQPRLGKQRVETLQLLRAALLPSYGWRNHPVTLMWRGYLPGLAAYGLASVEEWRRRGHVDNTADLILEFAPEVAGLSQLELIDRGLLPPWIGDEEIHRSHRSNLIRKDPAFYEPLFPGTPGGLDYVWPGVPQGAADPIPPAGRSIPVIRAQSSEELDVWTEEGVVAIGERSPRGRDTPAWRAQVTAFVDVLQEGVEFAALVGNSPMLARGTVTGPLDTLVGESGVQLIVAADYEGEYSRGDFAVPASLQDPRSVFSAVLASP